MVESKTPTLDSLDLTTNSSPNNNLKHLSFVVDAAVTATNAADQVYSTVRPYTPQFAEPLVSSVEQQFTAYGAPVYANATDVGGKLLARADDQVDYVAKTTGALFTKGKETLDYGKERVFNTSLDANIQQVQSLSQQYFTYLHDTSLRIMDAISPSKNITRAKESLHSAIKAAEKAADPDYAVGKVQEAWNTFTSYPAVQTVLKKLEPVTNVSRTYFIKAHDTLVQNSYYAWAIGTGSSTLSWASTTTPYKLTSKYLYPWVEPVAAPAIQKVSGSKSIDSAINYWKPIASV